MNDFHDKHQPIVVTGNRIPHWHQGSKYYFVTLRLADSLPRKVCIDYDVSRKQWLKEHPKPWSRKTIAQYKQWFSVKMDKFLDNGYGSCILSRTDVNSIVQDCLLQNNEKEYYIVDYVIMPNHVHILLYTYGNTDITKIVNYWKYISTREIHKLVGIEGRVWQKDFFDTIIRDENHLINTVAYIEENRETLNKIQVKRIHST